jgi:multidrug resistance efflux pump
MSADLDWARLESAVARAVERLRAAAAENQTLRAEVARLEAELESARSASGDGGAAASTDAAERRRTAEVRRRLDQLEGEIQSLLAG